MDEVSVKSEHDVKPENYVRLAHAVKLPDIFKFGDDFDLFSRQFGTFIKILNVDQAQKYNLLLSFFDKKAFNIAQATEICDIDKLNFDDALPKLKTALTVSEIPANIELRFRKQLETESLNDFGYAIQCLGFTAYGPDCLKHNSVIDAFCMGVTSVELSAKLLRKEFKSLPEAISFAYNNESASRIRSFVEQNRKTAQQVIA